MLHLHLQKWWILEVTEHKLLLLLLFKEKKSSRFDHLRDLTHGYFGPIGYPGALIWAGKGLEVPLSCGRCTSTKKKKKKQRNKKILVMS